MDADKRGWNHKSFEVKTKSFGFDFICVHPQLSAVNAV